MIDEKDWVWDCNYRSAYPEFTRWQRFMIWLRLKLRLPVIVKIKKNFTYGVAANSEYGKRLYGAGSTANKMLKKIGK